MKWWMPFACELMHCQVSLLPSAAYAGSNLCPLHLCPWLLLTMTPLIAPLQLGQALKLQHTQERLRDAALRRQLEQQQRQEAEAEAEAGRGAGSSSASTGMSAAAGGSADRPLLDDVRVLGCAMVCSGLQQHSTWPPWLRC